MRTNRWILLVVVVALAASALAGPPAKTPSSKAKATAAPSSDQGSPNIILVTLDTTRADRMGFLGSHRGLTPNLDALAKQSAVFTHAYSQVPLTTASHATILSGTYPQLHLLNNIHDPVATDLPYAPAILRAQGYHTGAFVGSIILNSASPYAPGFDRGFDTYDAGFHNEAPGQDRYKTVQRRGSEVADHAIAWLNKNSKGPFLLWVHMYDAHAPYDPPQPYKSRYAKEPYDGGIAYEDAVVGKLVRYLKLRGLYDGALIAIMADHGESLGAHGEDTHGIFLYDETIHVPLVIKLPHPKRGKRIENLVTLADVMPTFLQAAGVVIPTEVQGRSLLGLMQDETLKGKSPAAEWHDQPAYSQSIYPHTEYGWSALRSLRTPKYLYVQAPRRELYDRITDPKAERNLASSSAAVTDTLAAQTEAFRLKTSSQREAPKSTLDLAGQQQLGALGYMASGRDISNGTPPEQGPDPKDKIEIANMLHRAEMMQQDMNFKESISLLEEVIAKEPGLSLYSKLGDWLMRQEEYKEAVPVLRKAVEADPDSPMSHFQLAKAMLKAGDMSGAATELEFTEAKMPELVDAHLLLQMIYTKANRIQDAIRECQLVLQFLPDHYPSHLILGRELEVAGDHDGAITSLKKAMELEPEAADPHLLLADVYDHMNRKWDADRQRSIAKRLTPGAK